MLQVIIDGSTSHTHDPNRKLQAFLWEDVTSGEVVSKDQVANCFYPFGTYTMSLTITDDSMLSLSTTQTVVVAPEREVPGTPTCVSHRHNHARQIARPSTVSCTHHSAVAGPTVAYIRLCVHEDRE